MGSSLKIKHQLNLMRVTLKGQNMGLRGKDSSLRERKKKPL